MKYKVKDMAVLFAIVLLLAVVVEAAIVTNITIKGGGTLTNGGIFIVNTTNLSGIATGDVLYSDGSLKMVGNVTKLNIVRVGSRSKNVIEGFAVYVNEEQTPPIPYTMEIGPRNNFTLNVDGFNIDTKTQSVSLSVSSNTYTT